MSSGFESFDQKLRQRLEQLKAKDQLRALPELISAGEYVKYHGRKMCNLSSNDYLGLSQNKKLSAEFFTSLHNGDTSDFLMSASSSRLLTGNHQGYAQLEKALSTAYNGRAALAFNSGYHANLGILPALAGKGDLILSDKQNHASIIDGLRLSEATFKRYPHCDMQRLEKLLAAKRDEFENVFIVTESIFSMDGDSCDLPKLVELKNKYKAVLIVDEAHAVGVCGDKGLGLCEQAGVINDIDIILGTFGKAFCSVGAFAITSKTIREFLINTMRPLIYTTALPPIITRWNRFVLQKVITMQQKRTHLQELADYFRNGLLKKGLKTLGDSQIVPLITGENSAAIALAEKLQAGGILVFAIRPPTVAPGSARLRFSLHAGLTYETIDSILELL